jgi:MFS family permease
MHESAKSKITAAGRVLALAAALLGWLFDGAEMGLFSMVGRKAMLELLARDQARSEPGRTLSDVLADKAVMADLDKQAGRWFGIVTAGFLVGAATGGVLFGWLGDRIGRVRAMALSVFVYAVFTGLCGFAGAGWQLLLLRFIASLGMGGEWSLGVALVMEVWPDRSRAFMAGLIGAAANLGYVLVGFLGIALNTNFDRIDDWMSGAGFSPEWVDRLAHPEFRGWRLLMIAGTAPAVLTFLIRMFVPESERWEREHASGATKQWATRDLAGVALGVFGPILVIAIWAMDLPWTSGAIALRLGVSLLGLAIAAVGYTWPVYQFLHRECAGPDTPAEHRPGAVLKRLAVATGLAGIVLMGTWGSAQWAPSWADKITTSAGAAGPEAVRNAREWVQIWLAVGACVGTVLAAMLGDLLGRKPTYVFFTLASLGSSYWLFRDGRPYDTEFHVLSFVVGVCTASFYGWLPLYLPELFSTKVRATGQGFAFNFGRILAAVGALQTGNLVAAFSGSIPAACRITCLIYLAGLVLIWFTPETKGRPLPD